MIQLEFEKQRLKEYTNFLSSLFSIYHRKDGKDTKISRAVILSALCGSVSRTQILVSGMYGDFNNRDISNADRMLSSNSETNPGSGNRYKQKFKRIDSNADKNICCPIYTLTKSAGIPFLLEQFKNYFENNDYETILLPYLRTVKNAPRHFAHTNFSHDFIACAFSYCRKTPFYYPELLVCNHYAKESGIRLLCNKNINFRMDSFFALYPFQNQLSEKPSAPLLPHICCYEQDTGSQRTSVFQKKANAYREFFFACLETSCIEKRPGHFGLCFGIASVYGKTHMHKDSSSDLSDTYTQTRRQRDFIHLLKYSAGLYGIKNVSDYLRLLETAEKESKADIYTEHKNHLLKLTEQHKNINDLETLCKLSLEPYLKQLKQLQKTGSALAVPDFFKRRDFLFSHFDNASFKGLFLKGTRILSLPNPLMDMYFKFAYPSVTTFYDTYSASLNRLGISAASEYEILPCYELQNICFSNAARFHLMNGTNLTVITENFSLDLSSKERIKEFFQLGFPNDNLPLLLYMEYDKNRLHEFLYSLPKEIFSNCLPCGQMPRILFCCMEEAEQSSVPPYSYLSEDKHFVYGVRLQHHAAEGKLYFKAHYDIVPESASGITEHHQTLSLPVLDLFL